MNIEQLLKQYKELQFDPMEDPTGLNEEKEAKIEKDPTKEIKVVEPEIDGDSVCKKLLKKLESVQPDALDEKCGDKKDKKDKKEKELDEDITTFGTKLDDVNKQLKELINSLTTNEEIEESCGDKKKKKAKKIHEEKPGYMAVEDFEINGVWDLIKPYLDKEEDEYILYAGEFQALIDDIMTETEDATSENIEKLQQCLGEYYDQLLEEKLDNIKIVDSEIGGLDESCCGGDNKKKKAKKKSKKQESVSEAELVNLQDEDTKLLSDEQIAGQYKNFKCTHAEVQESKVNEDWFNVTLELEFPNAEHDDFDDYVIENLYYNRKDDKWGFDHWYPEEVVEEIKTLALAKIAEFEAHKNESLNDKVLENYTNVPKSVINSLKTDAEKIISNFGNSIKKWNYEFKMDNGDIIEAYPNEIETKLDKIITTYLEQEDLTSIDLDQELEYDGSDSYEVVMDDDNWKLLEFGYLYLPNEKALSIRIGVTFDNTNIKNESLNEELDKDVHYNFTIDKIAADTLKLTSGESEFEVYIRPEDDLQDIRYAIEDFVDGELAADEDDAENITGTEVVGFKYDIESGKGEFEATIFFDGDMDESCKKVKKNRKKMTEEEVLYDIYCDGELEDDKGRNAEYIIGFVNDIIDNMNDGIPEDEQVEHVGTLQQARKVGKTLQWTFPLHKMNESLNEEVVAKFDEGKHEIVKCKEGYYNRYNIKEGKARFTTKCMESLPTAMSALKKRYPKAEEVKV